MKPDDYIVVYCLDTNEIEINQTGWLFYYTLFVFEWDRDWLNQLIIVFCFMCKSENDTKPDY